mmetsp:Transcript_20650/g.32506  ORF Transcript_20650/g.32506 Transcript_20650/m.32506 type:complete len:270 (-) Transcript_20650:293-1102(-)
MYQRALTSMTFPPIELLPPLKLDTTTSLNDGSPVCRSSAPLPTPPPAPSPAPPIPPPPPPPSPPFLPPFPRSRFGGPPSTRASATARTNSLFSRKDFEDIPYADSSSFFNSLTLDVLQFSISRAIRSCLPVESSLAFGCRVLPVLVLLVVLVPSSASVVVSEEGAAVDPSFLFFLAFIKASINSPFSKKDLVDIFIDSNSLRISLTRIRDISSFVASSSEDDDVIMIGRKMRLVLRSCVAAVDLDAYLYDNGDDEGTMTNAWTTKAFLN